MPKIKTLDMKFLDEIFGMESGNVLDFSDRTIGSFFREELNIDIDDVRYAVNGTSKAKHLRCFLQAPHTKFLTGSRRTVRNLAFLQSRP